MLGASRLVKLLKHFLKNLLDLKKKSQSLRGLVSWEMASKVYSRRQKTWAIFMQKYSLSSQIKSGNYFPKETFSLRDS